MNLIDAFAATQQGETELQVQRLGNLATSGRITARDPLASSSKPFAVSFPSGCFDVELLLSTRKGDTRVELARVRFSDVTPVRFALALREGEDERALAPGQAFGYGVDSGIGSFVDAEHGEEIGEDVLEELQKNQADTWTWALRAPDGDGHRGVMFSSGGGDGIYSSYVGFDAEGAPVQLITDFTVALEIELPEIADDPDFRAALAEDLWRRVQSLLPNMATGKTYGDAYELGQELVAAPEEAAPLIEAMWAGLEAASDDVVREFHRFLIEGTLKSASALSKSLPHIDFEDPESIEQLGAVRRLSPVVRDALWNRFDSMHPRLREWFLSLVARDRDGQDDPRFMVGLRRALHAPATCELALRIYRDRASLHGALEDDVHKRVADLANSGPTRRARVMALEILSKLGAFPDALLRDPDPHRRFEAASALSQKGVHKDRSDPVLIALSRDGALTAEERFDAATHIWDETAKVDALVDAGLSGHPAAAVQIGYVGGPAAVEGLERLARKLQDPKLRKQAETWLMCTSKRIDRS